MKNPVLTVSQLTVNYDKIPVLWDLHFSVPAGGMLIGILGPNGAGKSTFIKAALKLLKPLSGKIQFHPIDAKVAYVPQRESVDWDFPITVFEVVLMGRYGRLGFIRRPSKVDREATQKALEMVGLEKLSQRQISQLSGGQRQRLFIARALVQDADIYFLDEPFACVDRNSEKTIIDLLRKLRDLKKTIFVVHHDPATVEAYFDWLILLNTRLIASGKTKEVFTSENIARMFGKNRELYEEASRLSREKYTGL